MRLSLCLYIGLTTALIACAEPKKIEESESPQGVVSTSLCGDSYLQRFAPNHIKALSWQSNSILSLANEAQKQLPQIDSRAENILPYRNSLIVFGPGEANPITSKLPFSQTLKWAESFEGVSENAERLLDALSLRKTELVQWENKVKNLKLHLDEGDLEQRRPKILYFSRAGGSAGPNTFIDAVINAVGAVNINPVPGWHTPDIETLLNYQPDIILRSFSDGQYHSRSDIQNPVVESYLADKTIIDIEGRYWPCAGPALLDAAEMLQDEIIIWRANYDA